MIFHMFLNLNSQQDAAFNNFSILLSWSKQDDFKNMILTFWKMIILTTLQQNPIII